MKGATEKKLKVAVTTVVKTPWAVRFHVKVFKDKGVTRENLLEFIYEIEGDFREISNEELIEKYGGFLAKLAEKMYSDYRKKQKERKTIHIIGEINEH